MIVAIIQARISSQRLPGKVFMDICGKPMLQRVIDRVKKSTLVDSIVIATTEDDKDIVQLAIKNGITAFKGSQTDVLDRFYQAVRIYNRQNKQHFIKTVVRITADCPLIEDRKSVV